MSRVVFIACFLAGCFKPNYEGTACGTDRSCPSGYACNAANVCTKSGGPDDAAPDDSLVPHDSSLDAPPTDAMYCLGSAGSLFRPCFLARPGGTMTLSSMIDTSMGSPACDPTASNAEVCVVAADSIRIPGTAILNARGARALVLVGASTIFVDGMIDLLGRPVFLSNPVAGSTLGPCDAGAAPTNTTGGGGAGASFVQLGARGGAANMSQGVPGAAIPNIAGVRGGCPGQAGATGSGGGANGARGGSGGGAVYLIAGISITVSGTIVVGGGGGAGGADSARAGGGGGGSGGLIGLDAPAVNVAAGAQLLANGGAGGEGSAGMPPAGMPGQDAFTKDIAAGGAGANSGGDGGNGGHGSVAPVVGLPPGGGGGAGGGGGSTGLIRVIPSTALNVMGSAVITPPAQ